MYIIPCFLCENVAKQFSTIEIFLLDFQIDPASLAGKAGNNLLKSTVLMGNPDQITGHGFLDTIWKMKTTGEKQSLGKFESA